MIRKTDGAVLCPQCRRLVHVQEVTCPYCGAARPGMFGFSPLLLRFFRELDLGKLIVGTCLGLYLVSLAVDLPGVDWSLAIFSLGSPSSRALVLLGMTGGAAQGAGHWWTLLTASFLHGSLLHVAFNVVWIRTLAQDAEEAFGSARFFVLYTLGGVGGFLLSNLVSGAPTIGASCAVFGLLGGLAAFGRRRGGSFGAQLSKRMWTMALATGVVGFMLPNVNNWGHAGGFLAGLLVGSVLPLAERKQEGRGMMILALLLLAATLAGFGVNVALSLPGFFATPG